MDGYTHLHFGAAKLALTFHKRKGLPVAAHLSLLDSRFINFQYAVVGTVQSTLNIGIVFVTLFLNFNISLTDPHAFNTLLVHVQITGTPQVATAFAATLHHQMAYRIQNHSFDILFLNSLSL